MDSQLAATIRDAMVSVWRFSATPDALICQHQFRVSSRYKGRRYVYRVPLLRYMKLRGLA